jgi:hypothetical protein
VTEATCHCGAVRLVLPRAPTEVTDCDCSICHSYGVLWAYCDPAEVTVEGATDTYARGPRTIDFHRCRSCGCVSHWTPVARDPNRMGVNARLLPREVLAGARRRRLDGWITETYLE